MSLVEDLTLSFYTIEIKLNPSLNYHNTSIANIDPLPLSRFFSFDKSIESGETSINSTSTSSYEAGFLDLHSERAACHICQTM